MALAETVLRKVHKLGLIPKIIRLLPLVSLVLAVSSLVWLLILPIEGQYRNTYISENALMPAQVTSYFRESEWNFVRGYRSEIKKFDFNNITDHNHEVESWLIDIGLKPQYHENKYGSDTLYTILHAPRGDDTESMVLAVPWITSEGEKNIGGLALGIAMARYFNRMSIWSKNIIFIFPQDGHASLRSWVEAYHTTLDATAGSIEAAIVMEYGGEADNFEFFAIDYEGLNGQLPNLDLINTATNVAYHEGLHCSLQGTKGYELTKNTYFTRLRVLVKGIGQLTLAGLSERSAGCEAFSGWQIQAITIRAKGLSGGHDITQFGRVVDSTLRSVNNLLEKFHQSFFFYLLLSPKYFVSIATYLPSAVLMAVSFAVSSLGCLLNSNLGFYDYVANISKLLTIFTVIELGCFLFSVYVPYLLKLDLLPETSFIQVLLASLSVLTLSVSIPPFFKDFRKTTNGSLNKATSYSIIALSLFVISMLIITLLIVHFALALSVGLFTLPLTFIQPLITNYSPTNRLKTNLRIVACLVVSNPVFVIYIVGSSYSGEGFDGILSLLRNLLTSWDELQCWTWFVVVLGWLPSWIGIALSCVLGNFGEDEEKKNQ